MTVHPMTWLWFGALLLALAAVYGWVQVNRPRPAISSLVIVGIILVWWLAFVKWG